MRHFLIIREVYMKKILILFFALCALWFCGCVSLEKMQKDADKGDEIAQVLLGLKYFYGSQDVRMIQYEEALRYFKMAAKQENPLACYYLGEIYEKGLGQTEVDFITATEYYKRAAKTMDTLPRVLRRPSYLALAKMYDFGNGVKKSDNNAKYYYRKAFNNDVQGAAVALADYLSRTRGAVSASQLEHILEDALEENEPAANYLYGKALVKQDQKKAQLYLNKSADGNCAEAIILSARLSRNRMLLRSAYEKAAALGYAPAFYELALLEPAEAKRFDLLKKSADRGNLNAIEALGDYHESRKEWNLAVIYHYMADRMRKRENRGAASVRLERTVGLGLAVESIWQDKKIPVIAELGTNIDYFIKGYRANIAKVRENYRRYLAEDPERSYLNMDYVRIYHSDLPMLFAGDIFRTYYDNVHGAVGADFYLNYAIAAGYAGQGAIQFFAAEKIDLKRHHSLKYHLAKLLLKANALALMGSHADAYELLLANYRADLTDAQRSFMIDFVNGNCNMLLKDIKKLSAALNVPAEKFVLYQQRKKQPFYDLENKCDSNMLTASEEPIIGKK